MSTPTNELDTLLMESLQQLSAEFQQRETRLTEQQKSCIDSFTEQSNTLTQQHDAITKRLDELTQHYKDTQALMQRVVKQLNALSEKLK
jgi:ABC-type transporter Mla subunit MlaD